MAIEIQPRNLVARPVVIPRPIDAAVRTVVLETGNRPARAKVVGHRVGNNQVLGIVPAVEQTGVVLEAAIAAGTEAHRKAREAAVAAALLVGDPAA